MSTEITPVSVDLSVQPAPSSIQTYKECEEAVLWLKAKSAFDKAVDAAHKESIALAHKAHKAALKIVADLKGPSDKVKDQVRTMIEAYAENPAAELPSGVYRRPVFTVRITDPAKVPPQYLIPDLKSLQDFAKRTEGCIPVPGVEFGRETGITVRSEDEGE